MSKPKETAVAIRGSYSINSPKEMANMANLLKDHVVKHKLYTTIVGKNYAHVEGWQFAGGLLGLFPRVEAVEDISKAGEMRWKAEVEIVNLVTDKVVSRGFAICSNKESKKKSFDEYAVLSMAQTRAIGKAYRNMIGWVMKLAGYEATPSEEMTKMGETPRQLTMPGMTAGPDGEPVFICKVGDEPVTPQEAEYSKKNYGRVLCREHQAEARRKKK